MEFHNRRSLKPIRRRLRNWGTPAEARLWSLINRRQLRGRRFRRQHSVGNYVLDFYCPAERLAVEVDGAGHQTPQGAQADQVRDGFLASAGIRVLRFENRRVFEAPDEVLQAIAACFGPVRS
jgi:very-short-patch-repair endonuclease